MNGEYYGVYMSVEQIDEEFLKRNYSDANGNLWKCLYPANLFYLGDNPDTYKNLNNNNSPVYELKTNEGSSDFTPLVILTKTINTYPLAQLASKTEEILHVDEPLKYFAMNLLLGQWDDYRGNNNNYYLYYTYSDKKFHIIPYDYDNTFGIDWANVDWSRANPYNYPSLIAQPLPLSYRLLQVPEYRNLYTYMLLFYNEHIFNPDLWTTELTRLKTMINS
ncbi:MAG TPA: CotH kinase family protein, partial [Bacteroidales bacterium]|nr:CotH kinase family protein [Bacteroidales bacterium]